MSWINDRKPTAEDADERGLIYSWNPYLEDVVSVDYSVIESYSDISASPWHPKPKAVPPAPYVKPETEAPSKQYWSKPSDFPPVCWMKRKGGEGTYTVSEVNYACFFIGGNRFEFDQLHDEFRWSDRPFGNYSDGQECLVEDKKAVFSSHMDDLRDQLADLTDQKIKELFPNQ